MVNRFAPRPPQPTRQPTHPSGVDNDPDAFTPSDIPTFFGIKPREMFDRLLAVHIVVFRGRIALQIDARDGLGCQVTRTAFKRRNILDSDIDPIDMTVRHYWFSPVLPLPESLLNEAA